VLENDPEAIVHEATALANAKFGRNFDAEFATTNELRTNGTDALLAAAREAGVRRLVTQSFASYRYAREGGPVKTEDAPLDPTPPANAQQSWAAMAYLDRTVTEFGGIVLRYGVFYGAANDGLIEPVRKRQYRSSATPGITLIHLDDAAAATVLHPARRPGDPQHRRRRAGARAGGRPCSHSRWGQAAPALPDLAGAAVRRRGGRGEYRRPRRFQRQGEALSAGAAISQLAQGFGHLLAIAVADGGRPHSTATTSHWSARTLAR
jgi:nucleoside-diphosphate-sugar epimerase